MAFIVLRRSRNTRNYYLVEAYRDERSRPRQRTLCYLGREQDGTDTLAKALAHWEKIRQQSQRDLRSAKGARRTAIRQRQEAAASRITLLREQMKKVAAAEAAREKRRQMEEEAVHWQAFDRLRREPAEQHAREAKRAFLALAKRHHPDQGGSHDAFLRLKEAYDRALAAWHRHMPAGRRTG
jgi:hypothetical protein